MRNADFAETANELALPLGNKSWPAVTAGQQLQASPRVCFDY